MSWCYLTIGHGVIVATQLEDVDCGTSITNIWDEYFFRLLQNLPEVTTAGPGVRWFEHYDRADPTIDQVILTPEGRIKWKFCAKDDDVAKTFEELIGEPVPDFAATGFEQQMAEKIRARRVHRM